MLVREPAWCRAASHLAAPVRVVDAPASIVPCDLLLPQQLLPCNPSAQFQLSLHVSRLPHPVLGRLRADLRGLLHSPQSR